MFFLRGRFRHLAGFGLGAIGAALLPATLIGWDLNLKYLLIAIRGITHPSIGGISSTHLQAAHIPDLLKERNISITNGILRIFSEHHLPDTLAFMILFLIAVALLITLWKIFQTQGIPFFWRTSQQLNNPPLEDAVFTLNF